ncbi:hypothetical protein UFOVP227_27 [uncultured Caudovirales phage]|uniref:Uncharacterized protein n=1 Tax=uncultured Caudovirales phage TaxID=2100421 RepID=A0A6J7WMK9_9CAUD|nr:hypothetical protein UFOVP227_27 [uncultured Caudovirales phage]
MNFIKENVWTWAGTGLALITLSGVVQKQALAIAGGAVLIQVVLALLTGDSE